MYRLIRWLVLMAFAWAMARSLPSLARYLRMREMSNRGLNPTESS